MDFFSSSSPTDSVFPIKCDYLFQNSAAGYDGGGGGIGLHCVGVCECTSVCPSIELLNSIENSDKVNATNLCTL